MHHLGEAELLTVEGNRVVDVIDDVADLHASHALMLAYVGAAFSAGFIFGPVMGGVLLQYGYKAPFLLAAGLQVVTLVMTIFGGVPVSTTASKG